MLYLDGAKKSCIMVVTTNPTGTIILQLALGVLKTKKSLPCSA